MIRPSIRIHLDDRARDLALEAGPPAGVSLHPLARAILEQAASDPGGGAFRVVRCTVAEARSLLDHFSGLTDALAKAGDPDSAVCAAARDIVRRAIVAAGA